MLAVIRNLLHTIAEGNADINKHLTNLLWTLIFTFIIPFLSSPLFQLLLTHPSIHILGPEGYAMT